MAEKTPTNEKRKMPGNLDLVKIDGHWAQVFAITSIKTFGVIFLENKTTGTISLNEYTFDSYKSKSEPKLTIANAGLLLKDGEISETQLEETTWGNKSDRRLETKKLVNVFGVLTKKQSKED